MDIKWETKSMSQLVEIIGGGTPKTTIEDYWNGEIPWISIKDFNNNLKYVKTTEKSITPLGLKNSSTKILKKGDMIISARGTVGELAMIPSNMAFNQSCYGIVPLNFTDNEFIYYLLKYNLNKLKNNVHGSVFDTITTNTFDNIFVSIPPLNYQKKISKILSDIDNKIETNYKINNNLEQLIKKIYDNWFIDYEPFNEELKHTSIREIPKSWEIIDLKDFIKFQEGPGIRNWQYVENGTKFVNIRCIQGNDLNLENANMISNEEAEGKYSHFMLNEWDIIISTSGTLGKFAVIRKEHLPLCLNTSIIRFLPKKSFEDYSYVYSYLISTEFYHNLTTLGGGSVQINFGPTHLKQIKMIKPTKEVRNKYHKIVFPLIKSIISNKREITKLTKLRDTLLPKLMSGEIDVSGINFDLE